MPAYKASETIARAVQSVLAQTHQAFELIIVSDDGEDYEAVLGRNGIADPRLVFTESGNIGGGSPPARNKGIDTARYRYSAILDADDRFQQQKLEVMLPAVAEHGLASCALNITAPDGRVLRHVGLGENRLLAASDYKFTNFSMDSMLVYDRERVDPRFDPALPCLTDLDFVLKLYAGTGTCYHFGTPLHDYVKMPVSVSNGPGVTEKMVATKLLMRERLASGHYREPFPGAFRGIDAFLDLSLEAERAFAPDGSESIPLFENHIEPRLANRQSTKS